MPKERDPFRKYVEYVEKNEWKCLFCGKYRGSATRIRAHLAGIPGKGIKGCEKVDNLVRAEASQEKKGEGSGTGGTSGKGTEGTVFGTGQSVLPRDDASDSNDTQNPNQLRPTGTGTAPACPQDQLPLPPDDMPPDNLDNTQQSVPSNRRLEAAHGNENASSIQQLPMDSSASTSVDFSELRALLELETHFESEMVEQNARGLSSFPNDEVCGNNGITPDSLLHPTYWPEPDLDHSLPENLPESSEANVNTFEEIQTNELHKPTVRSSSQIDSSLDVDGANRLLDCGQPCTDEVVPVRSNTSSTDAVQHPGQLPLTSDKEDENDIRQFPSRTPMVIDPSTVLQHSSDSHIFEATTVDSLVPEASTNPIGPSSSHASVPPQRQSVSYQSTNLETAHQKPTVPSSSQAPNNAPPPPQILPCGTDLTDPSSLPDMNEGAPITSHQNTGNNFGESSASKRKLELLYNKEAIVRDELEFAASLSLKKPRMEVVNWLANVEMLRNDCTEATSEDCLPSNQPVDKLLHEVEDLMREGKGLFEARETKGSKLLEEKMVGEAFKRNTMKILEYLEGNQISRLGIYGMGGVGKMTIMVHTHNRLLEKTNNGKVLWITVSQDFNTQRLQDTIAKELKLGTLQEKDVRRRAAKLCDCLMESGKSTIILDDVWNALILKRWESQIKQITSKMIRIEPLSHTEAERLFLEELGSEVTLSLETRLVVESIVRECAGLPLAIITMARSMQGVANVNTMYMEKKVLMKLEFSYNRLGNHEVQQCFLSCALYPKDELIDKFELIELFIDQGLIGRLNMRDKQYNRGLTILNKLENVCLLENRGRFMKMHDLIIDMALNIMSATSIVKVGKGLSRIPSEEYWTYALESIVKARKDLSTIPSGEYWTDALESIVKARKGLITIPSEEYWTNALEKVSLMNNNIKEFPLNMSPNCPKLSTFLLNGSLFDVVIPDSFFKHLRGLKVLNLSECCWVRELPDSISDLVNLRALLLRKCIGLHHIPHLGKLTSLRKLDIFLCDQVEAIEGLEKLVDLRHLDVHGTKIKQLPKGTFGALLNLQYLKCKAMNGEDIMKLKAMDLETLWCSFKDVDEYNKFLRVVCELKNKPRYYKIENSELAISIFSQSHTIVSVGRESSGNGICILIPQNLQKLSASNCDGVTNLFDMGLLENLEELEIFEWKNLRVLGGRQDEIINIHDSPTPTPAPLFFQSLRVLLICDCLRLRYLFGHGPKFYLPHLQKITIESCEEMVGYLKYICVKWCDKLKRVVESEWLPHFCNLRTIEVVYCKNMEEIIRGPPPYMPVEEISLEKLFILAYVNLRKLFSQKLLIHLPQLRRINVKQCKGMVEMISGAGQGQEGSTMTSINNTPSSFQSSISLPKLNYLQLCDLPQLKSICEVCKCPEMNRISLQLRIRDFEDPSYIRLQSEEKWKPLIWVHPNAQAILQSHPKLSYAGASKIERILGDRAALTLSFADGLEGEDEWSK
ncbi:hypothetical protein ACJRO7_009605 [Eucalyptus globulus]|uniref:NB-ARC domain-containing protein n=1 Tax=Eucalyptus globulus TaxID=34317 RepID=A0ABD3L986_EUCGL